MLNCFSCVWLIVTLWTAAHQAPLSMGFSRQEYWSGLPCPSPGDLLYPGIELVSLTSLALASGFFTTSATWEAPIKPQFYFSYISHVPLRNRSLPRGWLCSKLLEDIFCFFIWTPSAGRWVMLHFSFSNLKLYSLTPQVFKFHSAGSVVWVT